MYILSCSIYELYSIATALFSVESSIISRFYWSNRVEIPSCRARDKISGIAGSFRKYFCIAILFMPTPAFTNGKRNKVCYFN